MSSRAERKALREKIKRIFIHRFVEKLEKIGEYVIAMEETEEMIQKTIKNNPRDAELYSTCWTECEEEILKIGVEYLTERKMKKYKLGEYETAKI